MKHPVDAAGGWILDCIVYDDDPAGIAVALLRRDKTVVLALRWLGSLEYTEKGGEKAVAKSWMDGETGWFVVPFDLAVAVGKSLIEKKVAGLAGFDPIGFGKMVKWLVESEALADSMCY